MNFTGKRMSLMFLAASALFSLMLGCKSAVTTKTVPPGGDGRGITGKETKSAKPAGNLKTGEMENVKENAISALDLMKRNAPKVRLNEYFNAIANADNGAAADASITRALAMFASAATPVLMEVVDHSGKNSDYNSTTILAYFNSLKALKKNVDDIKNLTMDASGKIIEVELSRNNSVPLQ